ncbi:MAG: site-2 protease family protein [Actinomycetota bacterium]
MNPEPTLTVDDATLDPDASPYEPPVLGDAPANDNGSLPLLLSFVALFLALGAFRSWWIPGIIAGLLFMLFMHELGHYLTARASGMKVTEFFLGFGPKIWSFNRGETEYGVKAIPAGAYVRIIGMTNLDEIDVTEEHRTYRAQPYWQRMMVICAGSAMHFLMALVALVVLFGAYSYSGFNGPPWEVDRIVEGSSADRIGVQPGDTITEFDGEGFATWTEFGDVVRATPLGPIDVEVDRDGESLVLSGELGARPGDVVGAGFGLVVTEDRASQGWTIDSVRTGSNAAAFDFAPGDVLLRADDIARPSQVDLADVLQARDGELIGVAVLRGTSEVALSGVIELDRREPFRGFLGVGARTAEVPEAGWGDAIGLAFEDFATVARTNLIGIADLVNPANYLGDDDGTAAPTGASPTAPVPSSEPDEGNRPVSIIGIARLFAESQNVDEVLFLFMVVNIFIGIFNLVPLLPLDGGHAAMATWERGRQLLTRDREYRVDAAKLIPLTWLVVALLVVVGLWAAILDIFAWPA